MKLDCDGFTFTLFSSERAIGFGAIKCKKAKETKKKKTEYWTITNFQLYTIYTAFFIHLFLFFVRENRIRYIYPTLFYFCTEY